MRAGPWTRRIALAAAAAALAVGAAEGAGRRLWPHPASEPGPIEPCGDCPHLFHLAPSAPGVGPQGLRDRTVPVPREGGAPRILVLGDSVVHGMDLPVAERFTERLEDRLSGSHPGVEVINAGVPGFSTYNERTWYEAEGRVFGADLVIVGVCLNDVVDPLLHWTHLGHRPWSEIEAAARSIPAEAIPDPGYHRRHVLEPLRGRRGRLWLADRSALYRRFGAVARWAGPLGGLSRPHARTATVDGRTWPVQLTTEDELPITVWTDTDSPQWAWFHEQVEGLRRATAADGAGLALVVFPLAYQLDPGYPFSPQDRIADLAEDLSLPGLDLRTALREMGGGAPFHAGDDWHLSGAGHAAVAGALEDFVAPLLTPLLPAGAGAQSDSTSTGSRSDE